MAKKRYINTREQSFLGIIYMTPLKKLQFLENS